MRATVSISTAELYIQAPRLGPFVTGIGAQRPHVTVWHIPFAPYVMAGWEQANGNLLYLAQNVIPARSDDGKPLRSGSTVVGWEWVRRRRIGGGVIDSTVTIGAGRAFAVIFYGNHDFEVSTRPFDRPPPNTRSVFAVGMAVDLPFRLHLPGARRPPLRLPRPGGD